MTFRSQVLPESPQQVGSAPRRLPWRRPRLALLGDLSSLTRGGGGKVSGGMGDPGDNRKAFGQG